MSSQKYPISWQKKDFSIKIFCSIPNIATGILLKGGENYFVVDPGDGLLRDLSRELEIKQILSISDLFVTHGHHDHVGGVWSLLTYMRVMHKTSPLSIHYPGKCVEIESIHSAFNKVYAKTLPYEIKLKTIKDPKSFRTKNATIRPFPVIHKEYLHDGISTRQVPALGFSFIYNGIKICYGGDTAYCEDLAREAKGADLAIVEAGHEDDTPDDMHMTMSEAKSIGESAKEYFLVHVPE
ncbi:MAG TPA: MBL fold metallo-hydrolase [Ignavibacteriaceae bacterium]|nr:MBL fold metallo-hydrolase [Ignavibacteriaceae bacterium]